MKNPNGYGSVYKLSGNRRRPWIARVTTGWSDEGKQQYYTVGYFRTRREGMEALAKYHKNPIAERGDITLKELYKEWSKGRYPKLAPKTVESYEVAWNHLSTLKDEKLKDIKTSHIQKIINDMNKKGLSRSSCHKVKVLAGLIYKHALADDIVDRNYAEMVELPPKQSRKKEIFTDLEIKAIEELAKIDPWANTILILIYTGMRVGELLSLTKYNISIDDMVIVGGIKTDAGKDRIIPIHSKIQEHIKYWYNTNSDYLINREGKKIGVDRCRRTLYYPVLEKCNVRKLTPHSCSNTYASIMEKAQ